MLGKLIVTPCNLLLLDEPTNHLDMDSCDSLLAAIDAFDGAAVIVTHNEMFLHALATRFVVFDRGRVRVFDGSYQDFLDTVGWEMDEKYGRSASAPKSAPTSTVAHPRRRGPPARSTARRTGRRARSGCRNARACWGRWKSTSPTWRSASSRSNGTASESSTN